MKHPNRACRPWPAIALAANLLIPALSGVAGLFGWTYAPRDRAVFAGVLALLTVAAALLTKREVSVFSCVCALLVLPTSVAAFVSLVPGTRWLDICTLISFAAGWALFIRVRAELAIKIPLAVLWVLPTGILSFFLLLSVMAGPFGMQKTDTYTSPDGRYEVAVIEVDEGALGGSMRIEAREMAAPFPLLLGEFRKKPEILFRGGWQELEGELTWLSDNRFVIDGKEFEIE